MADIDRYVEHIKSRYKITRYDACKELRIISDLPEKAVLAIEGAIQGIRWHHLPAEVKNGLKERLNATRLKG